MERRKHACYTQAKFNINYVLRHEIKTSKMIFCFCILCLTSCRSAASGTRQNQHRERAPLVGCSGVLDGAEADDARQGLVESSASSTSMTYAGKRPEAINQSMTPTKTSTSVTPSQPTMPNSSRPEGVTNAAYVMMPQISANTGTKIQRTQRGRNTFIFFATSTSCVSV
jgi:hypothetical protein